MSARIEHVLHWTRETTEKHRAYRATYERCMRWLTVLRYGQLGGVVLSLVAAFFGRGLSWTWGGFVGLTLGCVLVRHHICLHLERRQRQIEAELLREAEALVEFLDSQPAGQA